MKIQLTALSSAISVRVSTTPMKGDTMPLQNPFFNAIIAAPSAFCIGLYAIFPIKAFIPAWIFYAYASITNPITRFAIWATCLIGGEPILTSTAAQTITFQTFTGATAGVSLSNLARSPNPSVESRAIDARNAAFGQTIVDFHALAPHKGKTGFAVQRHALSLIASAPIPARQCRAIHDFDAASLLVNDTLSLLTITDFSKSKPTHLNLTIPRIRPTHPLCRTINPAAIQTTLPTMIIRIHATSIRTETSIL